jgi:hypothetical protein
LHLVYCFYLPSNFFHLAPGHGGGVGGLIIPPHINFEASLYLLCFCVNLFVLSLLSIYLASCLPFLFTKQFLPSCPRAWRQSSTNQPPKQTNERVLAMSLSRWAICGWRLADGVRLNDVTHQKLGELYQN